MTPIETLHEAARLMRERAGAATQSPWHIDYIGDHFCVQTHAWDIATCYAGDEGGRVTSQQRQARANRDHIASWHPEVASAMADLFTYQANAAAIMRCQPPVSAIRAARAYLGLSNE